MTKKDTEFVFIFAVVGFPLSVLLCISRFMFQCFRSDLLTKQSGSVQLLDSATRPP